MPGVLDGYPLTAPAVPRPVIFDQQWRCVSFVHWPVDPDGVAHLFPRGTRPDVFDDGRTYVGLVPFVMHHAGFRPGWPVPYFGSFLETNIRLYSVDGDGRHGVLFCSLDTARAAIVPFARAVFGIPYAWSSMRLHGADDPHGGPGAEPERHIGRVVRYQSRRRWPAAGLRSDLSVRVGAALEPTPLERWLTARWGAHSTLAGRTIWVPNEHEPWPLHEAEVLYLHDDLLAASGVRPAGDRLRVLWSPGVRTHFGRPTLLGR